MKRRLSLIAMIAFTAGAMVFTGCKKDDTTPPAISLTGGDQTVSLGGSYSEPGYTASDDEDGDITSSVTVTGAGDVNTNMKGSYTVTYTVSDAAGNTATETRTVNVVNDADYLAGTYNVSASCQTSGTFTYTANVTTSNTTNNMFTINNFNGLGTSVNINANRSGSNITFPVPQTVGGSGSITAANGTNSTTPTIGMSVTLSYNDGTATEVCTDTYVHQ
jgi:hypothetical protein